MWLQYKLKKDRPFEEVAKEFNNKDVAFVLKHPKNGVAAKCVKSKQPVPAGTVVWLLDPRVTVYIMTTPKGKVALTEKEWKDNLKKINTAMDKVLRRFELRLDNLLGRHEGQRKVNEEFPIVSFFCSNWVGSKGNEPTKTRKDAQAAVRKLKSIVGARDYKNFEAAVRKAETAVNAYSKELYEWIEQLIGSGENWVTGLSVTRDASFAVFGACAMTVAAPATMTATLGWGATVGGGTAFMSSSANEVGKVVAGDDVKLGTSVKNIALAVAKGAAFGAAGAGITRLISGAIAGKVAEKMASSSVLQKMASRLVSRSPLIPKLSQRLVQAEIEAIRKASGKVVIEITPAVMDKMAINALTKVVLRTGTGSTSKTLQAVISGGKGSSWMEAFFKKNAQKIATMSEKEAAEFFAAELMKDPLALDAFEAIIKDNIKVYEAEFSAVVRKELERQAKAAK
jgi:hypothetical protein